MARYIVEKIEDSSSGGCLDYLIWGTLLACVVLIFYLVETCEGPNKEPSKQNTSTKTEQVDKTKPVNSKTNVKENTKTKNIEQIVQTEENVQENDGVVPNIEEEEIDEVDFGNETEENKVEVEETVEDEEMEYIEEDEDEEYNTRKRRRRRSR